MQYQKLRIISGKGDGPAEFRHSLKGIALDQKGRLYAAGDSEVKVFDTAGALLRRWSTALPPSSVAAASDGSVWVGQAGQVEIFSETGNLLRTWKNRDYLERVTSIGFINDTVLIGDASTRCIHRFDAEGRFLNSIGNDNRMRGLRIPNGVVDFGVDSQGVIHVANPGKHRVEHYSPEGQMLGHMGKFTGPDPTGFSGCCNPTNVAVVGPDLLCVTEKAGPRAKIYNFAGKLITMIESSEFDPGAKNMDVVADARGHIFISDPAKLAVFEFEPTGGAGS
jgi:sugar lactone lactonase YvrE